jgi:hypothetical protein
MGETAGTEGMGEMEGMDVMGETVKMVNVVHMDPDLEDLMGREDVQVLQAKPALQDRLENKAQLAKWDLQDRLENKAQLVKWDLQDQLVIWRIHLYMHIP